MHSRQLKPCTQGRLKPLTDGSDLDVVEDTPYRLVKQTRSSVIYSRYGFSESVPNPQPTVTNPSTVARRNRPTQPKTRRSPHYTAAITQDPVYGKYERTREVTMSPRAEPNTSPATSRARTPTFCDINTVVSPPPPQPLSRMEKVNPGSVKELEWTLSPYKHVNFDKKGQLRSQGPFSREFSINCAAPSNWMKMKWGQRHKQFFVT